MNGGSLPLPVLIEPVAKIHTVQRSGAKLARCRQPLPREVSFCAGCGFDNGEMIRMGNKAAFDEQIEERFFWLRMKQFFDRFLLRWWM